MPDLKSTLVVFGSCKELPFSTLGFVRRMQSLIKASPQNKSTASRVLEVGRLLYFTGIQTATTLNSRGFTEHWLNFYQPRKERIMVSQDNGFAPKSHPASRGLRCRA